MSPKKRFHAFREDFLLNKYSYLFVSIISFFIFEPLIGHRHPGIMSLFFLVTMLAVLNLLNLKRKMFIICVANSCVAFACTILLNSTLISNESILISVQVLANILYAMFFLFSIILLLKSIFTQDNVTQDTIRGAISVYFLLGFLWALIYTLIYFYDQNAFAIQNASNDVGQFIYFSFTTLTTLGYGDVVPISKLARNMTILESTTGQIYMTVLVARLVGLHIASKMK